MANYYLGIALKASGKYDEAAPYFKKLIAENEHHISARYHLGRLYMNTNKFDAAKEQLKEVIKFDPQHKNATEMLDYIFDDHKF